jgi:putative spermidine/putrescine transport system permease protein
MALADVGVAEPGLQAKAIAAKAAQKRSRSRRWAFLGILPFAAFVTIFLLIPTGELVVGAFRTPSGAFTLSNIRDIFQSPFPQAFEFSLEVSGLSALIGGLGGFLVANAVLHRSMPRWIRASYVSYSGMAANFAGIPLAFAFGATLGTLGVVTSLLKHAGVHLAPGFLQSVLGVSIVYAYFQLPLMVLLMLPVIEGLRTEWREAASNLGASSFTFWRYVGLPVITPSLLGLMVLLFGNAFSAYATAEGLGVSNMVTIDIAELVDGNIVLNPQDAYALATAMIAIIIVTVTLYSLLQRRASRWLR